MGWEALSIWGNSEDGETRLRKRDLAWSLEISVETSRRILDEKQLNAPGAPGLLSQAPS